MHNRLVVFSAWCTARASVGCSQLHCWCAHAYALNVCSFRYSGRTVCCVFPLPLRGAVPARGGGFVCIACDHLSAPICQSGQPLAMGPRRSPRARVRRSITTKRRCRHGLSRKLAKSRYRCVVCVRARVRACSKGRVQPMFEMLVCQASLFVPPPSPSPPPPPPPPPHAPLPTHALFLSCCWMDHRC